MFFAVKNCQKRPPVKKKKERISMAMEKLGQEMRRAASCECYLTGMLA